MSAGKTFRHGQILRLVADERISNQEELRRRLAARKLRVTQATLSRDLQELRLVKTQAGYKPATALPEEPAPMPPRDVPTNTARGTSSAVNTVNKSPSSTLRV